MSTLHSALDEDKQQQRRGAIRALLATPLLTREAEPELFAAACKHRDELRPWFSAHFGWTLSVDVGGGFARLMKVCAQPETTRPAALAGGRVFDRRRYVLLCLALAALDRVTGQTTLHRLAGDVESLSREEPGVEPFDTAVFGDRRAFVDVLKWLVEAGVLAQRDGEAERYASSGSADALFDLRERMLAHLLAAPVSPTLAGDPEGLRREAYAATDEGERKRARWAVMRRLVDQPVVYLEDLTARERDWLEHSLGFLTQLFEGEVGLRVERRREGLALVDPEGRLTDLRFPDGGSTARHAALLLCEHLTRLARAAPERRCLVPGPELEAAVGRMARDVGKRCGWKAEYLEDAGALTAEALGVLEAMGLVTCEDGGWRPLAAVARFAPARRSL